MRVFLLFDKDEVHILTYARAVSHHVSCGHGTDTVGGTLGLHSPDTLLCILATWLTLSIYGTVYFQSPDFLALERPAAQ